MIQKSVLLPLSADEGFRLFTERIFEWWPETHRPSKDLESELHLERTGRFWERARDGREMELGRVQAWKPPRRLALDFYIGTNAAQPAAVEITFTAEHEGTRVTVHHRARPESEELWNQRAPLFERVWDAVLAAMAHR